MSNCGIFQCGNWANADGNKITIEIFKIFFCTDYTFMSSFITFSRILQENLWKLSILAQPELLQTPPNTNRSIIICLLGHFQNRVCESSETQLGNIFHFLIIKIEKTLMNTSRNLVPRFEMITEKIWVVNVIELSENTSAIIKKRTKVKMVLIIFQSNSLYMQTQFLKPCVC